MTTVPPEGDQCQPLQSAVKTIAVGAVEPYCSVSVAESNNVFGATVSSVAKPRASRIHAPLSEKGTKMVCDSVANGEPPVPVRTTDNPCANRGRTWDGKIAPQSMRTRGHLDELTGFHFMPRTLLHLSDLGK